MRIIAFLVSFLTCTGVMAANFPSVNVRDNVNSGGYINALGFSATNSVLNVKAPPYNAIGDGIANDSDAIQAAINYASVTGSRRAVYLPAGNYKILKGFKATNLVMFGDGVGLTIITSGASAITNMLELGTLTAASSRSYIAKITWSGSSVTKTGIYSPQLHHAIIEQNRIIGTTEAAMNLGGGVCNRILDNEIQSNFGNGFVQNADIGGSPNNDWEILRNKIFFNSGIGIVLQGGRSGSVQQNVIENNEVAGIYVQWGLWSYNISDNYFESNADDGLVFTTPSMTVKSAIVINGSPSDPAAMVASGGGGTPRSTIITGNYVNGINSSNFVFAIANEGLIVSENLNSVEQNPNYRLIDLGPEPQSVNSGISYSLNRGFATHNTIATLIPDVDTGFQTYCSDVITPWGVGGIVEWDGSKWVLPGSKVTATATMTNYLVNSVSAALTISTPITDSGFGAVNSGSLDIFPRNWVSSGTGAQIIFSAINSSGLVRSLATGTTSTGSQRGYGVPVAALASGDWIATGASCSTSALADGSDNYWAIEGFSSTTSAAYPTEGAFFLVDMYNSNSHNQPYTNNFICVTGLGSSYTYADSGFAVPTSATSLVRLGVICTTTNVFFLTNGVQCASITTTIPTSVLYSTKAHIVKTLGANSRSLFEANAWYHARRATARVY